MRLEPDKAKAGISSSQSRRAAGRECRSNTRGLAAGHPKLPAGRSGDGSPLIPATAVAAAARRVFTSKPLPYMYKEYPCVVQDWPDSGHNVQRASCGPADGCSLANGFRESQALGMEPYSPSATGSWFRPLPLCRTIVCLAHQRESKPSAMFTERSNHSRLQWLSACLYARAGRPSDSVRGAPPLLVIFQLGAWSAPLSRSSVRPPSVRPPSAPDCSSQSEVIRRVTQSPPPHPHLAGKKKKRNLDAANTHLRTSRATHCDFPQVDITSWASLCACCRLRPRPRRHPRAASGGRSPRPRCPRSRRRPPRPRGRRPSWSSC